jgi:hypothetical protein
LLAVILSAQADTTLFHKWKNDIFWRFYLQLQLSQLLRLFFLLRVPPQNPTVKAIRQ